MSKVCAEAQDLRRGGHDEVMNALETPMDIAAGPAKILVVDDNEPNRSLAKESLEDEGYAVSLAVDGVTALAEYERLQPDCVLLDVRMPGLDGFAVCERIRALPGGKDVPVIFLTALRDVDTFDQALRAGGDDFLTKPIRPGELVARVHTALEVRQLKRALRGHYELFKEQRDALLRLQLQKERVIAFVVHDLKNPVNTIDLQAQTILRDRNAPPAVQESARSIRAESRQLNRMILNLLDVAKADEGQLAPHAHAVALGPLADAVAEELHIAAQTRKVGIRCELEAPEVYADEDLLRRVITNLVENAIRYAPADTSVTIASQRIDAGTEVRVSDCGRGVPVAARERIFDPFTQGEDEGPASRDSRGLGLAFCKRAAVAHGGSIRVEDAAPGARFCVFFPDGR